MSWDSFVNSLFNWCVEILIKGGHALGISYNEINIWIFCIIEPIVFILMYLAVAKNKKAEKGIAYIIRFV